MAVEEDVRLAGPAAMAHHHGMTGRFAQGSLEAHGREVRHEMPARAPHLGPVARIGGNGGDRQPGFQAGEGVLVAGIQARENGREGHDSAFAG